VSRFRVTYAMADICMSFLVENEGWYAPMQVNRAVLSYQNSKSDADRNEAIRELRIAIVDWMVWDRAACVGMLGPGLGLEEEMAS
jgi:hypothetical protein